MKTENFPKNKWTLMYLAIVDRGLNRGKIQKYTERHHIIPKCIGGNNSEENIVLLTAREHLIVHKLLIRIFADYRDIKRKMIGGLWAMAALHKDGRRIQMNSREFEKTRIEYFHSRKGMSVSQKTRQKISESLKGRKMPMEVINKRNETKKQNILNGKTKINRRKMSEEEKVLRKQNMKKLSYEQKKAIAQKSAETRKTWTQQMREEYSNKLSKANSGKKRTESQCVAISNALLGRKLADATREKISQAQLGKKRGARKPFTIISPSGETIIWQDSIHDFCTRYKVPLKYLYLSKKNSEPIKRGTGAGWQML
jgi:hypothetical protein